MKKRNYMFKEIGKLKNNVATCYVTCQGNHLSIQQALAWPVSNAELFVRTSIVGI